MCGEKEGGSTAGGQRPLNVSRRGGFFEDPFFRDSWGDYSHAVRRVVDRSVGRRCSPNIIEGGGRGVLVIICRLSLLPKIITFHCLFDV